MLKRVTPFVPGSLIAVVLGIAAAAAFDLADHGVDVVGGIETGLPSFGFPDVSLDDLGGLAAGSIGVLLVAFAEGLGAAKSYATRDHDEVAANRELIGLGAAGLGAGLSSGMVVNGSLSKTAVNWSAGARTQLSGVFVALLTVITLLFFTSLFERLPEAVLAAVVVAAVVEPSRPVVNELGRLPGNGHFAALDRHPDSRRIPGVIVLRVEAGLYFANAEWIRSTVRSAVGREGATVVVLDAETVPFIDVSAVRMLDELAEELAARGARLLLARDVGQVRDVLRTAEAKTELRQVYPTVQAAVDAARTGRQP